MKNKKIKKERVIRRPFVLPTHFELILIRKDKEGLKRVLDMLIEHGSHPFQWEFDMLAQGEEYKLCIQTCWADNLHEIASLLSDYEQDEERRKMTKTREEVLSELDWIEGEPPSSFDIEQGPMVCEYSSVYRGEIFVVGDCNSHGGVCDCCKGYNNVGVIRYAYLWRKEEKDE